jgi:hypothetical protein
MKNRLLAHVTITRQHKCTILAGDIRQPLAQMEAFVLAGALCHPPALCLCKINNPFLK